MATKKRSEWIEDAKRAERGGDLDRANQIYTALGMPAVEPPQEAQAAPSLGPLDDISAFTMETLSNIPGSVARQGQGLMEAASNPMETLSAIGETLQGGAQRGGRLAQEMFNTGMNILDTGETREQNLPPGPQEPRFQALLDTYSDRYGSPGQALETLRTDPATVALDVAGVTAPFSPRMGNISPPVAVSRGVAKGTGRLAREASENIMESAMKPSTVIPTLEREAMVRTALEYGINPTQRGVQKLKTTVGSLSDDVGRLIDEANAAGKELPADYVFKYLDDLREKKGGPLIDAGTDLKLIDDMEAQLRESIARTGRTTLDARDLQDIKLDLDQKINWVPTDKTKKTTRMEARKAMRTAAKEGVTELAPGVAGKNEQLSRLFSLRKPLERAESRISNRDLIGMGDYLNLGAGGAVGMVTGNPALGMGVMAAGELLTNPRISPHIAQGLKNVGRLAEGADRAIGSTTRVSPPMLMMMDSADEVEDRLYDVEGYAQ